MRGLADTAAMGGTGLRLFAVCLLVLGSTGCARLGDSFAGISAFRLGDSGLFGRGGTNRGIRTRVSTGKDKHEVTVRVTPAALGYYSARGEAQHAVAEHCIKRTGSSEADWLIDPLSGDYAGPVEGNARVFRARCSGTRI